MNYIYLHGFASGPESKKARYFRTLFADHGLALHTPDLEGGDFRSMTITRQIQIVEEIAAGSKGDIGLIGSSLGGYVSLLLAERMKRVKRLFLMAPAIDFVSTQKKRLGAGFFKEWKSTGTMEFSHSAHKNRKIPLGYAFVQDAVAHGKTDLKRHLPVLIFHGMEDLSVPWKVSLEYQRGHTASRLMLLHSDHSLNQFLPEMGHACVAFMGIQRNVRGL